MTHADALAEFFKRKPDEWVSAIQLSEIAGLLSWRTRVSELRKPPFSMRIENRYRRQQHRVIASEYKYVREVSGE